jgi:predicted nucleic acid-binding protein
MRIMLDTNVLISSIIFKRKIMNEMIAAILKEHRLVLLCD